MTISTSRSREQSRCLMERARQFIPGGVNSPVRAFKSVGGSPLFIRRGAGSRIWDEDGNEYIDWVGSWGPLILGHAPPAVVEAIRRAVSDGTTFGAPTAREVELAEGIAAAFPGIDMVRLVNSGTEATMTAIRLARAFTGRDLLIKFDGCYHGHSDALLTRSGSGIATLGLPDSAGVPVEIARHTISIPYNNVRALQQALELYPDNVAAVIIEPVAANMGVVPPLPTYLQTVRALCTERGALLICDEVITGFRLTYGGAQTVYGIKPDLTCLGKIIGGGLPVGAYCGRREVMELVAPLGPVYQAGTLSGNPLAVAAGIAALEELRRPGVYEQLEETASALARGLEQAAARAGVPLTVQRAGSMLTAFFHDQPVVDFARARQANTSAYARFFWALLERGVYLAPSQFEATFVSLSHTEEDIQRTVQAADAAFKEIAKHEG